MLRGADKRLFSSGRLETVFGGRLERLPAYMFGGLPDLANLQAWYDTSQVGGTVLSGSTITTVKDLSGNGYDLDGNGTTLTRTINGLDVADFPYTDGYNWSRASTPPDMGTRDCTMFFVGVLDNLWNTGTGMTGLWSSHSNDGLGWLVEDLQSGGSLGRLRVEKQGVAVLLSASGLSLHTGEPFVASLQVGASSLRMRLVDASGGDNVASNSDATGLTSGRFVNIGSKGGNGGKYWDGGIGECIRYSSALSDADTDRVYQYLRRKWGV